MVVLFMLVPFVVVPFMVVPFMIVPFMVAHAIARRRGRVAPDGTLTEPQGVGTSARYIFKKVGVAPLVS